MSISPLALAAKKVIDAAWLHGDAYDLSSQAAYALESAQLLQSPETAAEPAHYRAAFEAQQARAETLDGLLRTAQDRVSELESRLAEYERPADEDPIAYALTETAPLTVYRASHDSIVMGLYTTREAAQAHCETVLRREIGGSVWVGWVPDDGSEMAPEELCFGEDVEYSGYYVTPLEVAAAYDPDGDE